jgi:3'-5' exonuclease
MKLLRDIPTKNFIAIDIETVRIAENFSDLSEDWQSAWEYKCKQDGKIPDFHELSEAWEKVSSLWAEFSKVCAVSLAYMSESTGGLVCVELFGDDEADILRNLATTLDKLVARNKDFRLVGHAAKFFDYPFLSKRYVINRIEIPTILDTAHLKPWESKNLCSNTDIWKMGGTGAGSSLQALCTALGLPISKVDLVGDEVGNSYYNGEYERIGRYCSLDTIATFNVIRRIKGEFTFEFDDVQYWGDAVKSKSVKPNDAIAKEMAYEKPILEEFYKAEYIDESKKEQLKKLVNKKKLTKKDKVILQDMLTCLYIDNTMFKSDKPKLVEDKKLEIDEFVKSL